MRKKSAKQKEIDKVDRAYQDFFREVCHEADIRCEVSGEPMELCHHYIEKHLSANLRYDPENFVPITNSVHAGHHHFGHIINDTIRDKRGEDWYRRIREKMNIKTKIDIQKAKEQMDLLKKNKKKLIKNYKRFYFFTLSYERSKGTKTGARRNIQLP